jgi:hypothetical protein
MMTINHCLSRKQGPEGSGKLPNERDINVNVED